LVRHCRHHGDGNKFNYTARWDECIRPKINAARRLVMDNIHRYWTFLCRRFGSPCPRRVVSTNRLVAAVGYGLYGIGLWIVDRVRSAR